MKIEIEGTIVEEPRSGLEAAGGKFETMKDLLLCLDAAARDPRVSGVIVDIHPFSASFGNFPVPARIQELRDAIQKVNAAGKWTAAYITNADINQYYLASACKEVFMLPGGSVAFNGIALQSVFLRAMFDKLGIKPQFQHIGDYKTASNMFMYEKPTAAQKEMDNWLADSLWEQLINGVAQARGITPGNVAALTAQGVLMRDEAVKARLVDKLAYPDELKQILESEHGDYHPMTWSRYLAAAADRWWGRGQKIAVVYADGTIGGEENGFNLIYGKMMGWKTMDKAFAEIRDDPSIKGVVFRIDSPGGEEEASDLICRAAELTAKKIPIVVSMSDVAGSGGYWITTFSPPPIIFAEPSTVTASIGVLTGKFDLREMMTRLGITFDAVTRGKFALLGDSVAPQPGDKKLFAKMMAEIYNLFTGRVAKSRGMTQAAVDRIGRGRVFTGEQAKQNGLVDRIGGLLDAVAAVKEKAGIAADAPVDLVVYPRPKSLLQTLSDNMQGDTRITVGLPWTPGRVLVYMPGGI